MFFLLPESVPLGFTLKLQPLGKVKSIHDLHGLLSFAAKAWRTPVWTSSELARRYVRQSLPQSASWPALWRGRALSAMRYGEMVADRQLHLPSRWHSFSSQQGRQPAIVPSHFLAWEKEVFPSLARVGRRRVKLVDGFSRSSEGTSRRLCDVPMSWQKAFRQPRSSEEPAGIPKVINTRCLGHSKVAAVRCCQLVRSMQIWCEACRARGELPSAPSAPACDRQMSSPSEFHFTFRPNRDMPGWNGG